MSAGLTGAAGCCRRRGRRRRRGSGVDVAEALVVPRAWRGEDVVQNDAAKRMGVVASSISSSNGGKERPERCGRRQPSGEHGLGVWLR